MTTAQASKNMAEVVRLAQAYADADSKPSSSVVTEDKRTGRTIGDVWARGTLADQRALLAGRQGVEYVTVYVRDGVTVARIDGSEDFPPYTP
jgi:hypothetical protein